ncbi:MAG: hypothetical protein RLP09_10860 [Sandaracinaceae bacterium]|nr:MAG: hypothetical protein EVA89_31830 [Sandaracinaceae bacterium]HBQ13239.1 hypothetical protein [Myxococcales bacterium]
METALPDREPKRRVSVDLRMSRFELPPVQSALVVGRKAPIGSRAMEKALAEMMPDAFVRIEVDHETIEAVIVRKAHLRRLPEERLVSLLVRQTESVIDETEMLRVTMELEITLTEELDI